MKYKVGDRVRVVGDTSKHEFPIGTELTINLIFESHQKYDCYDSKSGDSWLCREQDLAPIEEPAQHYIYLGRIDGKLWLAGPVTMTKPTSNNLWQITDPEFLHYENELLQYMQHLATFPRIEYLGQETDFQMYQAVREGVDFEFEYWAMNPAIANLWGSVSKATYESWPVGFQRQQALPLSQDQRTIQATEQNNQTNMVNKLPILLPEEITSIQQLAEQMTAFPGVWNIHTLTRAVEKLNHDAASEVMIKLSASENEILRRYYGK